MKELWLETYDDKLRRNFCSKGSGGSLSLLYDTMT